MRKRSGVLCGAPTLGVVFSVFAIAFCGSAATAAAACPTPSGSYATGNPTYQVRVADDPTGSACVAVSTTDSGFAVNSTTNSSNAALRYTGFYSAYTGCNGPCYEGNYELPISSYQNIISSWSFSNFGVATPGKYDGVIDMFLNTNTTQPVAQPNGAEVMVWLNHSNIELTGPQLPDQVIEGVDYHVFSVLKTTPLGSWNRIAFERVDPVTSVSNLDLVPFLQAAESDGAVLPNWYLQYATAGFEIWYGGNGLVSNAFTADTPVLIPRPPRPVASTPVASTRAAAAPVAATPHRART